MNLTRRTLASPAAALLLALVFAASVSSGRIASKADGRILILMVWDGLRPDSVSQRDTPNLFALEREGVLFAHHHASFPTVTMVNAAVLATGAEPAEAGIFGDSMYFLPELGTETAKLLPPAGALLNSPIDLENSRHLAALNHRGGLNGYLLGVEGVAQQILRDGGYVAIVGKQGPTFLFDDQADIRIAQAANYLFVADDLTQPELSADAAAHRPVMRLDDMNSISDRDQWFARLVIATALPAARAAALKGHPALIVFWQHNPDLAQHIAGLGTQPALNALHRCDMNLASIRGAILKLGFAHRTDLMVVSDHGFATIRMSVSLSGLLISAGIKKSSNSADIVVARNGGEDLVYLSPAAYRSQEARRATLARIVDFAEAQEWCGAIFSKNAAREDTPTNRANHLGWIPGTFAQEMLGLYNSRRSPDLIISFRERSDLDNRGLTGPSNPAFVVGPNGQAARKNGSFPLISPIAGVVYSDSYSLSTGQGMHGAAGTREVHNFCAATGPDFRRHFIDPAPSGNSDVAPTIRRIFNLAAPAGAAGRVLQEALNRVGRGTSSPQPQVMTSYLVLQGQEVVTKLLLTNYDGREYLDDSSVSRASLNGSP
jgi:hypothetical protein